MNEESMPKLPIPWGELVDKLTILEIKRMRLAAPEALQSVELEYGLLAEALADKERNAELQSMRGDLRIVNERLWEVEDDLREHEARQDFGDTFVTLARSVYQLNDQRAAIKRRISLLLGSTFLEEKIYKTY